jgi:hypothetical protein
MWKTISGAGISMIIIIIKRKRAGMRKGSFDIGEMGEELPH